MAITVSYVLYTDDGEETVVFPAHYEVCHRCRGIGKHVHPAIDEMGITPEEFAEDPEFEERYFSGAYDVPCHECKGERVVACMDETLSPELEAKLRLLEKQWDDDAQMEAMGRMERMMGA